MRGTDASGGSTAEIRLIASDAGGTLLTSEGEITERTRLVVRAVLDRGIPFALVSGQVKRRVLAYRGELDERIACISNNGAIILHGDSIVAEHFLSRGLAIEASCFLLDQGFIPRVVASDERVYYQIPRGYCGRPPGGESRHVEASVADGGWGGAEPLQVNAFEVGTLEEACALARERFADRCSIECSPQTDGTWISLNHPRACKHQALAELAGHLGIPLRNVMYFGDNWNDAEALQAVGAPFVVANAPEGIRFLGHPCASNEEDGPAEVMAAQVLCPVRATKHEQ